MGPRPGFDILTNHEHQPSLPTAYTESKDASLLPRQDRGSQILARNGSSLGTCIHAQATVEPRKSADARSTRLHSLAHAAELADHTPLLRERRIWSVFFLVNIQEME